MEFLTPLTLKVTVISPDVPGSIGSFDHVGAVQPQGVFILLMTNGAEPSFTNVNTCVTIILGSIFPKSNSDSFRINLGVPTGVSVITGFSSGFVSSCPYPRVGEIKRKAKSVK